MSWARLVILGAGLFLVACSGGCGGRSPAESPSEPPLDWWHGDWVVDAEALAEDPALERLTPDARRLARQLVLGSAGSLSFDLGPDGCTKRVAAKLRSRSSCAVLSRDARTVVLSVDAQGQQMGPTWTLEWRDDTRMRLRDGRRTLPLRRR